MEYTESGVTYEFGYEYYPNTGEFPPLVTEVEGGGRLDGEIRIEWVRYNGRTHWLHRGGRRPRALSKELLGRMWALAVQEEFARVQAARRKLYGPQS